MVYVKKGSEFQVNTYTTGNQMATRIVGLSNGGFVVVWHSSGQDGSGYGVYGQRYNSSGIKVGYEFLVNTYTAGDQYYPSVTNLTNGGFAVVWHSSGQDGDLLGVYGQRYGSDGSKLKSEFRVNTYTHGDQRYPDVVGLNNGRFVVTWHSNGQDGSSDGVYGQLYDNSGIRFGNEFQVNTYWQHQQAHPTIASLPNSRFVIAWQSVNQNTDSSYGIYAQMFNNDGTKSGIEFKVNTHVNINKISLEVKSYVSALRNGTFAVVWNSDSQGGKAIYVQRFDNQGIKQGTEFRVDNYIADNQLNPHIMALNTDFVVTWASSNTNSEINGIYSQILNNTGNKLEKAFLVSTNGTAKRYPQCVVLNSGNLCYVWESYNQDGSGSGIYGQIFQSKVIDYSPHMLGATIVPYVEDKRFRVNTYVTGEQRSAVVGVFSNNNFVASWFSQNQDGSGLGVYAQLFNSFGIKQGSEFRVNTYTNSNQHTPKVKVLSNNNFVIIWISYEQDGSYDGIYGQLFNSVGIKKGAEFRVNSYTNHNQYLPSIDVFNNGDFIVVWASTGQESNGSMGIYGQLFDSFGMKKGSEFHINNYISNYQWYPYVGVLKDDKFVVVWQSNGQDGSGYGIYGQLFSSVGEKQSSEFRVNDYTSGDQIYPVVDVLENGNFIVRWHNKDKGGNGPGEYAQIFDHNGVKQNTQDITIYTDPLGEDAFVKSTWVMSNINNSTFIATWGNKETNGTESQTYAIYNSNITKQTIDFQIGSLVNALGDSAYTDIVTINNTNNIVMIREYDPKDGNNLDIYAHIYKKNTVGVTVDLSKGGTQDGFDLSLVKDIIGSKYNDILIGNNKDNIIDGGAGNDILTGGPGSDKFMINDHVGTTTITDFDSNEWDQLDFTQFTSVPSLIIAKSVSVNATNNCEINVKTKKIILKNINCIDLQNSWFYPSLEGISTIFRKGLEFGVNTKHIGTQDLHSVASFKNGLYVAVWRDSINDGSEDGIYSQLFDTQGSKKGVEFKVNSYTKGSQKFPAVETFNSGEFIVVWRSLVQDGSHNGIFARIFNAEGSFLGEEFKVSTKVASYQEGPSVTTFLDGSFVIVWSNDQIDGSHYGIVGQRYDYQQNKIGLEFKINTYTKGDQQLAKVKSFDDKKFIVVWESQDQDGYDFGIFAQMFNVDGSFLRSEFRVNSRTAGSQRFPNVATFLDGSFIIVWSDNQADGSYYSVFGQKYDCQGNKILNEFKINTYTNSERIYPAVAVFSDGKFMVAWESYAQDGAPFNIYIQLFKNNVLLDQMFQINDSPVGSQRRPALSTEGNGRVMVSWIDNKADGSEWGIRGCITVTDFVKKQYRVDKVGSYFQVNEYKSITTNTFSSSIAVFNDSTYLISWPDYNRDGHEYDVYGQLFSLNKKIGSNFRINSYIDTNQYNPVSKAFNNLALVTWQSYFQDGSYDGVYAQFLSSSGNKIRSELRVNTYTLCNQYLQSLGFFNDGKFIVVWSNDIENSDRGVEVYGQLFNKDGSKIGNEVVINSYFLDNQWYPDIAVFLDNSFLVVWQSNNQINQKHDVYGQLYLSDFTKKGNEFRVNTYTEGEQKFPKVLSLGNNKNIITWISESKNAIEYDIHGKILYNNGTTFKDEFKLNQFSSKEAFKRYYDITLLNNDTFAVVYSSDNYINNSSKILGQIFNTSNIESVNFFVINNSTLENQVYPSINTVNDTHFIVTWTNYDKIKNTFIGIFGQVFNVQFKQNTTVVVKEGSTEVPTSEPTIGSTPIQTSTPATLAPITPAPTTQEPTVVITPVPSTAVLTPTPVVTDINHSPTSSDLFVTTNTKGEAYIDLKNNVNDLDKEDSIDTLRIRLKTLPNYGYLNDKQKNKIIHMESTYSLDELQYQAIDSRRTQDIFNYIVFDRKNGISQESSIKIFIQPFTQPPSLSSTNNPGVNLAPIASSFVVAVKANMFLDFRTKIYDQEDSSSSLKIKIMSLPLFGKLIDITGQDTTLGSVYFPNVLQYIITNKNQKEDEFNYMAVDTKQKVSNVAQVKINILYSSEVITDSGFDGGLGAWLQYTTGDATIKASSDSGNVVASMTKSSPSQEEACILYQILPEFFTSGSNLIEFRYKTTANLTLGYGIINMDLVSDGLILTHSMHLLGDNAWHQYKAKFTSRILINNNASSALTLKLLGKGSVYLDDIFLSTSQFTESCMRIKKLSLGDIGDLDRDNEEIEFEITASTLQKPLDCGLYLFSFAKNYKQQILDIALPCKQDENVRFALIERDICNDDRIIQSIPCKLTNNQEMEFAINPDSTATSYSQCINAARNVQGCTEMSVGEGVQTGGSFCYGYSWGKESCGAVETSETASKYTLLYEVTDAPCNVSYSIKSNRSQNHTCISQNYIPGPTCKAVLPNTGNILNPGAHSDDKFPTWVWGIIGVGGILVVVGAIISCRRRLLPPVPPGGIAPPIGLSLNTQNIYLIRYNESTIFFDYNDNNKPIKTSWLSSKDALLIYDHNNNKKVDMAKELVLTKWSSSAKTDFEALLDVFDSNKDLIFDKSDQEFNKFLIWQDKNQNGISEQDELQTMIEAGLLSIDFNTQQEADLASQTQGILNIADIYWQDGRITKAYDLALEVEYINNQDHLTGGA